MLYIGWDIGIKNLAYCIIEYKNNEKKVIELEIINLIEDLTKPELSTNLCCILNKNKLNCKTKPTFIDKKKNVYYCKRHYNQNDLNNNKNIKLIKKPKKIKIGRAHV